MVNSRYCTNDRNIFAAGINVIMIPKPNFQYTYGSPQEMAEKVRVHLMLGIVHIQTNLASLVGLRIEHD